MDNTNYKKILSLFGFLLFGTVSCWATAESLHLLLATWPIFFCYAIAIGFFIIASIGFKMIPDSFNQNVYMENRGTHLVLGTVLVIVFWLFCSMPTNTHTFFYRNLINDRVSNEITTTQGYLAQIKDGTVTEDRINAKITDFRNQVNVKLGQLEAEIRNEANPGNGPRAKAILSEFASLLDVPEIKPLSFKGTSQQEREVLCREYRKMIYTLRDAKEKNIINEMTPANDNYKKVAERDYKNLDIVKENISNGNIDVNDAEDVKMVCDKINQGYSTIKMYSQFVNFKNNDDKVAYTASNPQTKVSRLLSVYDVWVDFLKGRQGGLSFVFWILISILVDLAAFIFFDMAFKKTE